MADAYAAEEAGDLDAALALYRQLEAEQPTDPAWSKKVAGIHRRRDEHPQRVAALIRAAEKHDARGEPMKGLATLKIARQISPDDPLVEAALDNVRHAAPRPTEGEDEYPRPATGEQRLAVIPLIRRARAASGVEDRLVEVRAATSDPRRDEGGFEIDILPPIPPIPLFSALDAASFAELLDRSRLRSFDDGETIFERGDSADALYVVVDGAVEVVVSPSAPPVARLESGAFFGEMSLFTGRPRNATVRAAKSAELLVVEHAYLTRLLRRSPAVLEHLVRFFRERLVANVLARVPGLGGLSDDASAGLRSCFRLLDVAAGHVLIAQGRPSPGLFIVVDGNLAVTHTSAFADVERLAQLGPKDMAGEISTLTNRPATATVTAEVDTVVLALPRDAFDAFSEAYPALRSHVAALAGERIERLPRPAWC